MALGPDDPDPFYPRGLAFLHQPFKCNIHNVPGQCSRSCPLIMKYLIELAQQYERQTRFLEEYERQTRILEQHRDNASSINLSFGRLAIADETEAKINHTQDATSVLRAVHFTPLKTAKRAHCGSVRMERVSSGRVRARTMRARSDDIMRRFSCPAEALNAITYRMESIDLTAGERIGNEKTATMATK